MAVNSTKATWDFSLEHLKDINLFPIVRSLHNHRTYYPFDIIRNLPLTEALNNKTRTVLSYSLCGCAIYNEFSVLYFKPNVIRSY
jgi:hypothetical protein